MLKVSNTLWVRLVYFLYQFIKKKGIGENFRKLKLLQSSAYIAFQKQL